MNDIMNFLFNILDSCESSPTPTWTTPHVATVPIWTPPKTQLQVSYEHFGRVVMR